MTTRTGEKLEYGVKYGTEYLYENGVQVCMFCGKVEGGFICSECMMKPVASL